MNDNTKTFAVATSIIIYVAGLAVLGALVRDVQHIKTNPPIQNEYRLLQSILQRLDAVQEQIRELNEQLNPLEPDPVLPEIPPLQPVLPKERSLLVPTFTRYC